MTNHVLLDNVTHRHLRVNKVYRKGHGYDVQVARAFPVEFARLQAEYPLFFTRTADSGHFEAVAVFGFSEHENLYLGDGRWRARYIPLSIERQPFLIGFQTQEENGFPLKKPVVHVDLDHPCVNDSIGEAAFLAHGGESPYLERVNSILLTIHQGHEQSQAFSRLLVGLDLVESLRLEVEFKDGSKHALKGLYTINEDKLRKLNPGSLETLHRQGHLQNIYMMLASLPNVATLVERRNEVLKS